MDVYQLTLLALLSGAVEATSSYRHHHPQVREDPEAPTTTYSTPSVQHYKPTFEYGKVAQPDMQKWRYYQQQRVDAKNFAKFQDQIRPLYQKRVNVDGQRNDWKPVLKPQTKRSPGLLRVNRKNDYENDLEVQATSHYNAEPLPSPQFLAGHVIYNQNNQDIAELNSILGQPQSTQLQGLQKLLQVQSEYAPQSPQPVLQNQNVPSHQSAQQQNIVNPQDVVQPHPTQILAKPQQVDHLQAELDFLSQGHVQKLLQEAEEQARNQVKLQHEALERAKVEAENAAMAKIQAHNSGVADVSLQAPSNAIDEKPESSNLEPLPVPQALTAIDADRQAAIDHAIQQAHTYLKQSGESYFLKPLLTDVKIIDIKVPQQPPATDYQPSSSHLQGNVALDSINDNINTITKDNEPISNEVTSQELKDNEEAEDYNEDYADEYAPNYKFGYQIVDYHSGNDYGHEEVKDGKMTKGQYHILLPDGRTQNVEYWADSSGYHAKVTYTTVAQH